MLLSFFLSVAIHLVPHVTATLPNGQGNEQDAEHDHCSQELLNGLHRIFFLGSLPLPGGSNSCYY
jgi:hypothetical protein